MNINVLADSIAYQDIFKINPYIEKGYNLFKSYAYKNDIMTDRLMSFYVRKYNDKKYDDLVFISEEEADIVLDYETKKRHHRFLQKEQPINWTSYYPSSFNPGIDNIIIFYGFEEYYGKYWYSYFDLSECMFLFVDEDINTNFFNTFFVDQKMSFDQTKIYYNRLTLIDLNQNIPTGYFCIKTETLYK